MNTLISEPLAKKIRFESDTMWVELADGRQMGVPLAYFPRLLRATDAQRKEVVISEDIAVRGLLMGIGDRTRSEQFAQQEAS